MSLLIAPLLFLNLHFSAFSGTWIEQNGLPPPSRFTCFFSSKGGAPLGAQIGAIMIIGIIAFVGAAVGIGGIALGRCRRFDQFLYWACLGGSFLVWMGLVLWVNSGTGVCYQQ